MIDNENIKIQLYSPCSKKGKYGLGKFGKRYEGKQENKDIYSEEIIEICTIVNDFNNLKSNKIPSEILDSISENPTINWSKK